MAAAIIPIVAALAPDIISLIAALVHKSAPAAEQQLGEKTGPVKFAQVFQDVINALTAAAGAGQIPKALPPDDSIKVIIQAVVSSMKLAGMLDYSTPAAPASSGAAITVKAGQMITITGV